MDNEKTLKEIIELKEEVESKMLDLIHSLQLDTKLLVDRVNIESAQMNDGTFQVLEVKLDIRLP